MVLGAFFRGVILMSLKIWQNESFRELTWPSFCWPISIIASQNWTSVAKGSIFHPIVSMLQLTER